MALYIIYVVIGLFILGIVCWFGLRTFDRRPTAAERAAAAVRSATLRVDDAFYEARIRMEEAAGTRRPGEQRIEDAFRSSWRSW